MLGSSSFLVFVVCFSVTNSGTPVTRDVQTVTKKGSALMLYYIKRVDEVKDFQTSLKNNIASLRTEIVALKSEVKNLKLTKDPVVYFRAELSTSKSFGAMATIVFDEVDANVGGGYNPTSGIFTAPFSGYYKFSCQVETYGDGHADYVIVNQGARKALLTIRQGWATNTMSTIIHVTAGHHVSILRFWDNGKTPKLREGVWTQFTGYLLRKD